MSSPTDPALGPDQGYSDVALRTGPPTNGLAVAAFVVSFFWGLLGLIFGIVARRQIRRDGTRGNGLAVAAIVIGSVRLLLELAVGAYLIAGLVTGSSDHAESSGTSDPVTYDPMANGSCYDAAGSSVDCAVPHQAEILAHVTGDLTSDAGRADAEARCRDVLASFAPSLSIVASHRPDLVPESALVPLGDDPNSTAVCLVTYPGDVITGSALSGVATAID